MFYISYNIIVVIVVYREIFQHLVVGRYFHSVSNNDFQLRTREIFYYCFFNFNIINGNIAYNIIRNQQRMAHKIELYLHGQDSLKSFTLPQADVPTNTAAAAVTTVIIPVVPKLSSYFYSSPSTSAATTPIVTQL